MTGPRRLPGGEGRFCTSSAGMVTNRQRLSPGPRFQSGVPAAL